MHIEPLEKKHFKSFRIQEKQKNEIKLNKKKIYKLMKRKGLKMAFVNNDNKTVLIGGYSYIEQYPVAWAILDINAYKYLFILTKMLKTFLTLIDKTCYVAVNRKFKQAQRWLSILGFEFFVKQDSTYDIWALKEEK